MHEPVIYGLRLPGQEHLLWIGYENGIRELDWASRSDMQGLCVRIPLEANIYRALLALPGALPTPSLVNMPNRWRAFRWAYPFCDLRAVVQIPPAAHNLRFFLLLFGDFWVTYRHQTCWTYQIDDGLSDRHICVFEAELLRSVLKPNFSSYRPQNAAERKFHLTWPWEWRHRSRVHWG